MRLKNLAGQKFGRLTVIERAEDYIQRNGQHKVAWKCKCDCGNEVIVQSQSLLTGNTKSCGCIRKEIQQTNFGKANIYDLESYDYGVCYTNNNKHYFIFDLEDYDLIKNYSWTLCSPGYYQGRKSCDDKKILLHRLIMGINNDNSYYVDHINHNTTDNRKCNLRICTPTQNSMNKMISSKNTSNTTGVCWDKGMKKWVAIITENGKQHILGYFEKIEDAITLRKEAEDVYFGEFSYDNSMKIGENNNEIK